MPNKKSAKKELRKNDKRRLINKKQMSGVKKLIKDNLEKVKELDKKVKDDFRLTMKAIDKAAKKGLIKKNTASRKKSRLQKKINTVK